ncbi:TNF receptor-associated factor 5-like [Clytia hemisphaerica]|uniref:TNF receptor-associated factor 5-like n=1 Tax=Clytia hemisphaerica TaxID=252671 RepID=UPI0034D66E93
MNLMEEDEGTSMGPTKYDFRTVEEVDEKYVCPKCRNLMKGCVETPCGHNLCDRCLQHDFVCSVCDLHFRKEKIRKCTSIDDHICKVIQVLCKSQSTGCQWTGLIEAYYSYHDKECLYKKVACPNIGYYVFLMKKALQQHIKVCDQRTVFCKFCKQQVLYVDFSDHSKSCNNYPVKRPNIYCPKGIPKSLITTHLEEECLEQMVDCSYVNIGCENKIKWKNMDFHLKDFTHDDDDDVEANRRYKL